MLDSKVGVELRSCYESRNCIADDRVALSFSVLGFSILDPGTAVTSAASRLSHSLLLTRWGNMLLFV